MNNTSRFKFYGILTALILVVVGVVWFYPRREHSSKVPHVKREGVAEQAKRPTVHIVTSSPQQPVTSSTRQPEMDYPDRQGMAALLGPTLAHAFGLDIPSDKLPKIVLTPEQEKQAKVVLNAIKNDVMQMLAGNASYQQTDDNTIVINTRLSQEQSDEIDKRLYKEMGDVIGAENVEKLDSVLLNGLREATYAWGPGARQYTVVGVARYYISSDKRTEQPLKTAESFQVKMRNKLVGGINFGGTYDCTSRDSFIKEFGVLAVAALQKVNEEGN